jgi:hypothetical protein
MLSKSLLLTLILQFGLALLAMPAFAIESRFRKDVVLSQLIDWRSEIALDTTLEPREKDLRLQLASRLLFQVERKYEETDLRKFMLLVVTDMKRTDEMRDNQSYGGLSDYLDQLHEALDQLIEPREDVIGFIREFTRFSTIENPRSLDEFAETRNYSDGKEMEKADPMDTDLAAETVAEKLAKASEEPVSTRNYLEFKQSLRQDFEQDTDLHFVTPIEEQGLKIDLQKPANDLLTEQSPEI